MGVNFIGIHNIYNNNGFNKLISIKNPSEFYKSIKTIIDTNWIKTLSQYIVINVNFFNFNINSFINITIYYERISGMYYPKHKIFITNIISVFDGIAIASIIFAVFTLITSIIMILRNNKSKEEINENLTKKYNNYLYFEKLNRIENENCLILYLKAIYYNVYIFLNKNFVAPDKFLILSKLSY